MPLELRPIHGHFPAEFARMTSAANAGWLRELSPGGAMIAVGAREDGWPVGLGVARAGARVGEVLSLFVAPAQQGRGIGTQLLAALEDELAARGCVAAEAAYSTLGRSVPALEKVLQRRGWSAPEPQLLLAQIHAGILEAPWMQRCTSAPAPFALFPWNELSAAERASMAGFQDEVPPALWPLAEMPPADPHGSLGLRRGDEIAGWLLTHRVPGAEPPLIRFTMLFVRERWRTPMLSFLLVAEAARRLFVAYGANAQASLAVQVENTPMRRVLERKIRPWTTLWAERRRSTKRVSRLNG
jgi:GNAT superfamily N-acetyltransferase